MTREQHTLTIRPRDGSLNADGLCSCATWHIRNRSREDIRAQHAEHIQERLGPDGTERTER